MPAPFLHTDTSPFSEARSTSTFSIGKSTILLQSSGALCKQNKRGIEETLKPINEEILKGYLDWNNTEFLKDNISRGTQTEFRTWNRCIFT